MTVGRVRYMTESGRIRSRRVTVPVEVEPKAGQAKGVPYTVMRTRVEVPMSEVEGVLNRMRRESPYWRSVERVAKTIGVTRHAISRLCQDGLVRCERGVLATGRTGWLIPRTEMPDIWERYDKPGMRRKQLRQKTIDGTVSYCCTLCDQWKPRSEFRNDRSNTIGITSRCRPCLQEITRGYRQKNRERDLKREREAYERRRQRTKTEGAKAHHEYERAAIVEPEKLWAIIEEYVPDATNAHLSDRTGIHADHIRRTRRAKCTVDVADRILTALDLPHLLNEVVDPPGFDGWSSTRRQCRGCGRCDRVHMGRGYCYKCLPLVRRGIDPAFVSGWTRNPEVQACRMCGSAEREHFLRGLCSPCHYRAKKLSLLDQYPRLYGSSSTTEGDGDDGDADAE